MNINIPKDLLSNIEDKHLLLDTNVFIDSSINPTKFSELFDSLRENGNTLITLDLVKIEFLRGARDIRSYETKEAHLNDIVESVIPLSSDILKNSYKLVKKCKEGGRTISVTDLYLGACLMSYPKSLYLLTKDTSDFPNNIFILKNYFHLIHTRAVQIYGVYTYEER